MKKGPTKKEKMLDVVYLHLQNKRRLEKLHDEIRLTGSVLKFHPFAESIIVDYLDLAESQAKLVYPIEFKAIVDRHIVLMDNVANKPVLVAMVDAKKTLHCDSCDSNNCQHVGFAYGNRDACKTLAKKDYFPANDVKRN